MSILDMRYGHLEPTATYSERIWKFVPADDGGPILGTLTIICEHAKRNKVETTRYHVIPVPARNGRAASVELANVEDGEVYTLTLDPEPRCTCKASQCKLRCKHLDTAIAMELDDPGSLIPMNAVGVQSFAPPADAMLDACPF